MTREELKKHCLKQIENCEMWARHTGEEPHGKVYEEHKLILELLDQAPCDDCISRQAVLEAVSKIGLCKCNTNEIEAVDECLRVVKALPPVAPQQKTGYWIPVSERLPDNTEPVNITWVNHNPDSYYADIKDKPFTATGHYCNGRWWWYSATCQDYLNEYGRCDADYMDNDIEVIAWMLLPEPYKPQESEKVDADSN